MERNINLKSPVTNTFVAKLQMFKNGLVVLTVKRNRDNAVLQVECGSEAEAQRILQFSVIQWEQVQEIKIFQVKE